MDLFGLNRVFTIVFLLTYLISGVYFAWAGSIFFEFEIGNLLLYIYFALPLLVIIFGVLAFFRRKNPAVYFWICSLYWFIVTLSEIVEDGRMLPSTGFVVFMFVISIMCMTFLILKRVMNLESNNRS